MDRLHLETLGPIEGAIDAAAGAFMDAIQDGDLDRVMRFIHPEVVIADHHLIGWGSDSRFDDLRDRMRTLTEPIGSHAQLVQRSVAAVNEPTGATTFRSDRRDN